MKSAPRAYRLKASNAAPPISTFPGAIPRYRLDSDGTIVEARIVPPTSQNQASIEEDLVSFIGSSLDLPDDALRHRCEQTVRNYDPCISCFSCGSRWIAADAMASRRIVLGIGNAERGDDAVGLAVVRLLRASLPDDVEVAELEGDAMELFARFEGAHTAFLVDASWSGAPAGTVRRIDVNVTPLQ